MKEGDWKKKKMAKSSLSALLVLLTPSFSSLSLLVLLAPLIAGNRAPSILEHPLDMTVARLETRFSSLFKSCGHFAHILSLHIYLAFMRSSMKGSFE